MKKQGKFMRMLLAFFIMNGAVQAHDDTQWTWFFSKKYTNELILTHSKKDHTVFSLESPRFSQLIFSWNAHRPAAGHFRFWVQVRDAKTKKWYEPHHMIDWGKDIQRSYISTNEKGTNSYHVRLEVPAYTHADAFRIKVEVHNGANLTSLKRLHVCVSDMKKFSSTPQLRYEKLPSVLLTQVPQQSQMVLDHPRANNLCSPTSLSMMLGFVKKTNIDPLMCAEFVYDSGLDSYGSWPFNAAHAFEMCNGKVVFGVARFSSFMQLHQQLMRNMPVMVSVRGELEGAAKSYNDGHLLLVVGWDAKNKKVICHDPAFEHREQIRVSYDLKSFLTAWGRSRNLAYSAEKVA